MIHYTSAPAGSGLSLIIPASSSYPSAKNCPTWPLASLASCCGGSATTGLSSTANPSSSSRPSSTKPSTAAPATKPAALLRSVRRLASLDQAATSTRSTVNPSNSSYASFIPGAAPSCARHGCPSRLPTTRRRSPGPVRFRPTPWAISISASASWEIHAAATDSFIVTPSFSRPPLCAPSWEPVASGISRPSVASSQPASSRLWVVAPTHTVSCARRVTRPFGASSTPARSGPLCGLSANGCSSRKSQPSPAWLSTARRSAAAVVGTASHCRFSRPSRTTCA